MNPPESAGSGDRPLPFVVRVAAEWVEPSELDDAALLYRERTPLTGNLDVTARGGDVQVSDIGVLP